MEAEARKNFAVRDICYIGIFVAIIVICAVGIPLMGVPFTLQTWGIALAGMILGPKKGVIAVVIYILLGAVGVPVFSNFRGGLGVIMGATGGFIVSFPVIAFMTGFFAKKGNIFLLFAGLLAGAAINYIFGMVWFSVVTQNTIQAAFAIAVAPFILPDIIKMATVIIIGKSIQTALKKAKIAP
ncbi:MAG: biotin transporter BioY [Defluviitaleaceae bacterium]|nr:biotin transporter BioY [Defluviitaleaceae bacterium]